MRAHFFERIRSLNPGITEIYFHPSVESDKLKDITGYWQQRVWEAQLFADPEVINFLEQEEIIFTNWKELMKRHFSYVNKDDETCGDNTPCYPTIQEAIDASGSGATIKITQGSYGENLTLQGGWDPTFTTQSSNTIINSLTMSSGAVTVDSMVIQ